MEKVLFSILITCFVVAASGESSLKETFSKYKFHFKTGDTGDHTRTEESNESGNVIGMYSYKDPNGVLRTVRYKAAPQLGFQAYGEGFPQFGNVPLEYYADVSPTDTPVSQLSIEDQNNEKASSELANQDIGKGFPQFGNAALKYYANVSATNLLVDQLNIEDKSNETILEQASEVSTVTETSVEGITSTSADPKSLQEIESESSTEAIESSAEPSTISPDMNNNRLVPVYLPYGSFHRILIHSGHLYYPVPHALAYSLMPPNYQMVL